MPVSRKQRGCAAYRRCPINKARDCLEEEQGTTKAPQNKVAAEHKVLNLKVNREWTGREKKIKTKKA